MPDTKEEFSRHELKHLKRLHLHIQGGDIHVKYTVGNIYLSDKRA